MTDELSNTLSKYRVLKVRKTNRWWNIYTTKYFVPKDQQIFIYSLGLYKEYLTKTYLFIWREYLARSLKFMRTLYFITLSFRGHDLIKCMILKLIDSDNLIAWSKIIYFIDGSEWHLLVTRNNLLIGLVNVWWYLQSTAMPRARLAKTQVEIHLYLPQFLIL